MALGKDPNTLEGLEEYMQMVFKGNNKRMETLEKKVERLEAKVTHLQKIITDLDWSSC